ncbi:MAG TPA: ABC transporter substrate-binding protein [Acidimicrobiia bacterium]|nr:ABC transporter substrate-binding protein [Acidimicrobiia bacterium]
MRTRTTTLATALVALALIASACSSSSSSNSSGGSGNNSSPTTSAQSADPAINQWAITYTHGKPQKATGAPLTIGYVNQDSYFPEATIGVDAAVAYANAELNGADGRQIVIKTCQVVNASDGAKCGAQMANDSSIQLVLTGTLLNGNSELYNALNGKKAVIIGNGVTPADFVTPAGEAFVAGAPGVLKGMAIFATQQFHPKTVALLANDNAAGHAGASVLMQPIFTKAGATVRTVFVSDTANGAQVQSAMQAAGAGSADVFVSILTLQTCISMYDAIKSLNIKPTVVTTGLCFGTPMTDHLQQAGDTGAYPDGWYFGGYGYSYFLPGTTPGMAESGMNTYLAKVHQYGKPAPGASTLEYSGFAGPMFANVLTAVKFVNEIGAANLSVPSLDAKIRGFTGPMMLQVGPLKCNVPPYVSVCGSQIGIQQYKNGKWVSIADGHNGKPIDTSTSS